MRGWIVLALFGLASVAWAEEGVGPGQTRVMGGGESRYTGERISLDFKDADIKDVLRFLADFGQFNLVLDESVQGKVTIKLRDVPWDQALDIILLNHGLAADRSVGVIRTAETRVLVEEEADQRRLLQERKLAAPLVTVTRTLAYAQVRDVAPLVRKLMSPRGTVIVDARTNTLIIRDVPAVRERIEAGIERLDRER